TIHYKLRYAGGSSDPLTVSNSATAYNVTATADADITPPREVTKEMDRNSGNSVAVTVDINPTARLYDGTPNGPITVTDTMSGTLSAYLSTIKIYTEEPVGSGNWVQQPVNTTPNALWSYTPVGENEIDFIIQDSTHTRITYNCLVVGDQGTAQSISNTVEVAGYYSTASQNSFEIQSTSATGNGNRQVLTVHKYDAADDKNSLQGAQFALYAAAMNNDGTAMTGWTLPKYSASAVPAGVPGTEAINGVTFYYVGSGGAGVTDANGNFTFNNTWLTPLNFMTYLLVELQAPTNYSLPADPYTLVAYRPVAADIFGYPVNQIGDNIAVANDLIPHAQATINGIKTVLGTNNPNKVFTFALTQVDSGEIPIPGGHTDVSTTFGAGTFGFTLTDLDANSVYYYQIAETNADGSLVADDTTWTYDHDALTVKVTTDGDGSATVTYPAGSTYTDKNGVQYASFTNTYKLADAKIPVNKTAATSENVTVPVDMPTATFDLTQINKPANPAAGPNGQTAAAPGYSDSLILTGLQIPGNTTGSVAFAINGLAAGAYYYLVTEEPNGGGYWTFDQGYCIVTVTVGDESSPSVSYDYQAYVPNGSGGYAPVDAGGPDYSERAVAFTNTYSTECKVPITINKTLTGAATVDDTFIFNAYEADSAWNIASGTDPVSVSLDGTTLANDAGNGVGSVIMQLPATVGSTTYYVINEAQGGNGSVTYDGTVYYVAVTATVGQDGDIVSSTVISVSKDGSDPLPEVSFTNAFTGGPRLPETGGAGTRAYTVIGTGILLAAGMSLLFYRKRKTSRR
ncbi:MAG: SpaA isopeptide-forming pilin-related protein, partial [Defluviitaleaceae bacterium]|nr:SpaA isopeptide-forming pilin-related protein [Defluviitaleaceae bacterium]